MSLQIILKNSAVSAKEPTVDQLANGELALNFHADGPFLSCKDTAGVVRRVAGVWINSTAPATPTPGEFWLDIGSTPALLKVYKDSTDTWVGATTIYAASTSQAGIVELATDAETQTGSDFLRAVTPASLQSKLSSSAASTSTTAIANSAAVKTAKDAADAAQATANAALARTGGTITGNLEIGTTGSLSFEGTTADGFETTIAVVDPTADNTITLPNVSGTVVTTGDIGTVTSTMLADGTIVDADISASAEIAVSKLADGAARQLLQTDAAGTGVEWASNIDIPGTLDVTSAATFDSSVAVTGALTKSGNNVVTVGDTGTVTSTMILDGTIVDGDINASAAIAHSKLANITAGQVLLGSASNVPTATALSGDVTVNSSGVTAISSGVIVNADVNASAAIAGTKISPDFGSQTITTTGIVSAALGAAATPSITFTGDLNTGIYSPGADQVAVATNGVQRINIEADGDINIDSGGVFYDATNNRLAIGTTSPSLGLLEVSSTNGVTLAIKNTTPTTVGNEFCQLTFNSTSNALTNFESAKIKAISTNGGSNLAHLTFENGGTEKARIDSSGRLLVGTSSYTGNSKFAIAGGSGTDVALLDLRFSGARPTGANSGICEIRFGSPDQTSNNSYAKIECITDGASSSNTDLPARLVFSTTADGASSPTERMRITQAGLVGIGTLAPLHKLTCYDSIANQASVVAGFTNTYDNLSPSATTAYPVIRLVRDGVPGATYPSMADLAIARFENVSSNARTRLDFRLSHGDVSTPENTVMSLLSGGTVGIGTLVPAYALDVAGAVIQVGAGDAFIQHKATLGNWHVGVTSSLGSYDFYTGTYGTGAHRASITPAGDFLVGKQGVTPSGNGFLVSGNAYSSNGSVTSTISATINTYHVFSSTSSTYRFYVSENGGVINYAGNNINLSDEREKKNIANLKSTWDCLKHWELKEFNYNEDSDTEAKRYGVIAQQIAPHCPEVISTWTTQSAKEAVVDDDGIEIEPAEEAVVRLGVKEQQMYWMAIKALQEAQVRIEQLETEMAAVKAQLA